MESSNDNSDKGLSKNEPLPKHQKLIWGIAGVAIASFLFVNYMLYGIGAIQNMSLSKGSGISGTFSQESADSLVQLLEKEVNGFETRFKKLTPRMPYIIINTTQNEFRLFSGKGEIRSGFCSTGSYTKLYTEKKSWIFKTPRGVRRIIGKVANPVWTKPDWAFIEEGLPVPPPGHPSRYESGVLGDYALALGDGYLIHGTLYQRFIGQPVTHGCVRMGDEDLEAVYKTLQYGSKVYIY